MENNTTLLEQLENANKLAKQVATMESDKRKAYMDKLLEVYNDFRTTIFELTDEIGIIMKNYEWVFKECYPRRSTGICAVWENDAKMFALENGFSFETVKKLYAEKNSIYAYGTDVSKSVWNNEYHYFYFGLVRKK